MRRTYLSSRVLDCWKSIACCRDILSPVIRPVRRAEWRTSYDRAAEANSLRAMAPYRASNLPARLRQWGRRREGGNHCARVTLRTDMSPAVRQLALTVNSCGYTW